MTIANLRGAVSVAAPLLIGAMLAACGGGNGTSSEVAASTSGTASTAAAPAVDTATGLGVADRRSERGTGASPGKGYFVDAATGSDTNAGSFAAPWRSLAKLGSVVLADGDSIYLRCGSVWRESLELSRNQLIDGATVTGYGADCTALNKPRISAADNFSGGWTKSGNVWSRRVAAGLPKIAALLVNAAPARVAQWPNFNGIGREYALTDANAASFNTVALSAADRTALAGKDLSGAAIQLRTEPWIIEPHVVNLVDASGIKLRANTNHRIDAGDGFVLQDKLWMVDAPGEFFHDTATGTLYLYPPDSATQADLNAALVEGTVREVALVVSGRANLSIKNLAVDMARTDGITVNDAPGAQLDGVDASNNLWSGVRVNLRNPPAAPVRGGAVRNGRYLGNAVSAIDAGNAVNIDLLSNTATGTGMGYAVGSNAAIIAGDGNLVQGNVIEQSAFRGILFSGFGGTKIAGNVLSGYCLRLADCAAIYTVNGIDRQSATQMASVEANRVTGGTLNVEGTTGGQLLAAIYLDDKSRGVTVRGNVLTGMPIGIFVHNSSNNLVEANKVWLTTNTSLLVSMDNPGTDLLTGNVFRANQLAPSSSVTGAYPALPQIKSSQAIRFLHAISGQGAISSGANVFAGNQVVAFNGDTNVMADVGFTASFKWLNATEWMALNPGEIAPSAPATFATYKSTLGAELLTGGGFDSGLGQWTSWFAQVAAPGSVAAVTGPGGCSQQCARLIAGAVNDRLSSPLFRMTAGAQYMVSFTASFAGTADIAHPNIARPDTPFESFIDAQGLKSKNTTLSGKVGDVIAYEAFFTAASSEAARINLRVETPGVAVAYDSVSLRPVTGYDVSNFSDWGSVVSAPSDTAKTVACADLGWPASCSVIDVDGNAVAMPATLGAGMSRLLLLSNSVWRR